jgi:predicted DNA-binding transcriptional regulator AlpA
MENDPKRLVAPEEARHTCGGISDSTMRRLIAANDFPKPVVLNRNRHGKPVRIAFVYGELVTWCEQRIAAARNQAV